jgi:hypothetical protein
MTPASKLCPGTYVGSVPVTLFDPHVPVLGWQLSPLEHVPTCPSHAFAKTRYKSSIWSVGTCTSATRCTIACPLDPPVYAVTTTLTSSGLCPANNVKVVGSEGASIDGTR